MAKWTGHKTQSQLSDPRGPLLVSPGNFLGSKYNIQTKIQKDKSEVLESKPVHFGFLTDGFMILSK